MKYYSALKRKQIPIRAMTWMNLEDSMPSGNLSVTKGQILCNSTHDVPRIVKFIETESNMILTKGWGKGVLGSL